MLDEEARARLETAYRSQTAALLATSEIAVRVHLHAARKRLRGALEEEVVS